MDPILTISPEPGWNFAFFRHTAGDGPLPSGRSGNGFENRCESSDEGLGGLGKTGSGSRGAPLYRLAESKNLWERRMSILATLRYIRNGDCTDAMRLAQKLIASEEDLMHKAVGWMLREVGRKDRKLEEAFLAKHCRTMPRTMLRDAI
jgi:hypothetical protein